MRVASTIVTEGRGWVSAGRALDEHADELERAIHLAAVVSIARRYLVTREVVRTALENVRQRLESWAGDVAAGDVAVAAGAGDDPAAAIRPGDGLAPGDRGAGR
jgi:hypothetical protein